ncbi:MAG: signal peptidase I [Microthrixaceae bacterium]
MAASAPLRRGLTPADAADNAADDPTPAMRRGGVVGAVALAATVALAVLTAVSARPGRTGVALLAGAAILWGGAGLLAALLTRPPRDLSRPEPAASGHCTTVMFLGGVPDEVARATAAVTAASGPVVLVCTGREPPPGLHPGVAVVRVGSGDDPVAAALTQVRTDAVLMVSARAVPVAAAVTAAAARLADGVDAVVGTTRPLNPDRFGPDRRDRMGAAFRARARHAGLWLWEPDATVVRSDLLRHHRHDGARPWGAWLRERVREGACVTATDDVFARRAAPVAAAGYWPDSAARQHAAAADLADAARASGPFVGRAAAAALVVRAVAGWSLVLWAAVLVWPGSGFPFRMGAVPWAVALVTVGLGRWLALHRMLGVPAAPVPDALAAVDAVPGSLASLEAVVRRRLRPPGRPVPTRPLVWLALAATAVAGLVLLSSGSGSAGLAGLVGVGLLVVLWVFTVRALVERDWQRNGFRVRLDLAAKVHGGGLDGGAVARVVDGSPGGLALRGRLPGLARGDEVSVQVELSDGRRVRLAGTVAARREVRGGQLVGVQLRSLGPELGAWSGELFEAAGVHVVPARPAAPEDPRPRLARVADRVVLVAAVGASVAVVAGLALVLLGIRPLVVRSPSMVPTYEVGDVVLARSVPAGDLEVGDVVTRFDSPDAADSLTHRVRAISREGDMVTVETRGDANATSEVWSESVDHPVGVVVASIPWIGLPATMVRSSWVWAGVAALVLVAMVAVLLVPRFSDRRARRAAKLSADRGGAPWN